MLITKTVIKKWSDGSKKYYIGKGYVFTKDEDYFEVKVNDLSLNEIKSKVKIECINPECKNTKEVMFRTYIDRLRDCDLYLCTHCFQDGYRIDDFIHKNTENNCNIDGCKNKEYENGLCLKHHVQKEDLGYIVPNAEHSCEVCDSEVNIQFHNKAKMYLCRKHRLQYDRNGFFQKRTIYDPNDFIIHKDYADMELYDLVGNVAALTQIDIDDVDRIKKYKWHLSDTGYVMTCIDGINLRLHKYILNQYGEQYKGHDYDRMVDHTDRNKLNNRKTNLRIVTDSQNKQNRDTLSNSKTGRNGLATYNSPHTGKVYWKISITVSGNKIIDKQFSSREEAEHALDLYELIYKPFCPHYDELKEKYKDIYSDLLKYGVEKYI